MTLERVVSRIEPKMILFFYYGKKLSPDDVCITKYAFNVLVDLEMERK
jgi:hypothetical protein